MTNELAIKILTGDVIGTTEQTQEAVTMAVRALSKRWMPCIISGVPAWIPWPEPYKGGEDETN